MDNKNMPITGKNILFFCSKFFFLTWPYFHKFTIFFLVMTKKHVNAPLKKFLWRNVVGLLADEKVVKVVIQCLKGRSPFRILIPTLQHNLLVNSLQQLLLFGLWKVGNSWKLLKIVNDIFKNTARLREWQSIAEINLQKNYFQKKRKKNRLVLSLRDCAFLRKIHTINMFKISKHLILPA